MQLLCPRYPRKALREECFLSPAAGVRGAGFRPRCIRELVRAAPSQPSSPRAPRAPGRAASLRARPALLPSRSPPGGKRGLPTAPRSEPVGLAQSWWLAWVAAPELAAGLGTEGSEGPPGRPEAPALSLAWGGGQAIPFLVPWLVAGPLPAAICLPSGVLPPPGHVPALSPLPGGSTITSLSRTASSRPGLPWPRGLSCGD